MLCPNCKTENVQSSNFCKKCGSDLKNIAAISTNDEAAASIDEVSQLPAESKTEVQKAAKPGTDSIKSGTGRKNSLFRAVAVVGVILIAVFIIRSFLGRETLTYIKDGEVYKSDGGKQIKITQNLFENSEGSNGFYDFTSYLAYSFSRSADGKNAAYAFNEDIYLYDGGKENEKIASDASWSLISPDGSTVAYIEKSDESSIGDLYVMRKGKEEKIGQVETYSEFTPVALSKDGSSIAYINSNDEGETDLYIKKVGGDQEKIDSDVEGFFSVSDDLNSIIYGTSDAFYLYTKKNGKEKIADDMQSLYYNPYDFDGMYVITNSEDEEGNLYFFKPGKEKIKIDSEVMMVLNNPVTSDKSTSGNFRSDIVIYTKDAGNGNVDIYVKKNGKDKEKLVSGININAYNYNGNIGMLVSVTTKPRNTMNYSLFGAEEISFLNNSLNTFAISDDYKYLAYVDYVDSDKPGTLYVKEINKGSDGKKIRIDSDAAFVDFVGDKLIYLKNFNYENGEGDLYVSAVKENKDAGKMLALDVNHFEVIEEGEKVFYMSDYSQEKSRGTLYVTNMKKSTKVSDDVSVLMTSGPSVAFLKEYNFSKNTGDLYIVKGSKAKKIDTDVNCLISID